MELIGRLNNALGDRYRIDRLVGRGGMASVFAARDLRHDRLVAVKVLHHEIANAVGAQRGKAQPKHLPVRGKTVRKATRGSGS